MSHIEISPASVLAELDNILMSSVFSTAARPSRLLRFLVQETIDGRGDSLKEYTLGTSVLGRTPSFDPRTDPIARVEASRLRDRLDLYYATEGRTDPVTISLPKGGYIPSFEIGPSEAAPPVMPTPPPPIPAPGAILRMPRKWIVAVSSLLALAGVATFALLRSHSPAVSSLRLSVMPPPNASIDSFAISPDGARIVIAATSQNTSFLFLRPLNSFTYQKLSGTEGAWNPFWSPDGASIGFFTLGTLKAVEAKSGAVRSLCEAALGRGGSWSRSGEIVFAPGALGPLYRISASGGKPVAITSLDSSGGETGHRWPQFLPDGRHFLYFAFANEYGKMGIDIGDLDSHSSRRIVAADTNAAYVRNSIDGSEQLLFVRHGTLTSQAFDSAQFRTLGDPVTVSPEVNYTPLPRYAQFSVSDSGVLAYVPGSTFNEELTWFDRVGTALGRVGEPGDFTALHLSPDGKRVILNRSDPELGFLGVWSIDLLRGSSSRLTSGWVDFSPVWSPDGSQFVFARAVSAERGMTLSEASASGGSTHPLKDITGAGFPSDWSSNGHYVAYTGYAGHSGRGIYILPVQQDGAGEPWKYLQTEHNEGGAMFSPAPRGGDPKWIAYTSDESGRNEVYIQSFPKAGTKLQVSPAGGSDVQWRSDAKEIYYLAPNDDLMALDITISPKLEAGLPRRMFRIRSSSVFAAQSLNNVANYAPSRDGQRFLVSRTIAAPPSSISVVTNWVDATPGK